MRIAMGFCRRSGPASDAAYIDRQLQAVTNILRTQGDVWHTLRRYIIINICIWVYEFESVFIRVLQGLLSSCDKAWTLGNGNSIREIFVLFLFSRCTWAPKNVLKTKRMEKYGQDLGIYYYYYFWMKVVSHYIGRKWLLSPTYCIFHLIIISGNLF